MLKKSMMMLMIAAIPMFVQADVVQCVDATKNLPACGSSSHRPKVCPKKCNDKKDKDDDKKHKIEYANFYLTPDILGAVGSVDVTIDQNDFVPFQDDAFTYKTSGISVDDPTGRILFQKKGLYSISYIVFANRLDNAGPFPDFYTMALNLNSAEVPGSRFTSTLALTGSDFDASQLQGQVLVYISAGSYLALQNVSYFSITTENEGGNDGIVASIVIQQIK